MVGRLSAEGVVATGLCGRTDNLRFRRSSRPKGTAASFFHVFCFRQV